MASCRQESVYEYLDLHELVEIEFRFIDIRTAGPGLESLVKYLKTGLASYACRLRALTKVHAPAPQGDICKHLQHSLLP